MKQLFLLSCMVLPCLILAQSFQELCQDENTNGTVVNMISYQDTVYATGFFTQACGESTDYVARWDENTWVPASIALSDPGHHMEVIDDQLFIARYEESIDSNWIYTYEDGQLEKFGQGVYLTTASGFSELPNLYNIIKYDYDGSLVACGEFDRVGAASISGIMRWDGNQWTDMGGGLSGNIQNTAPVMFPHELLNWGDRLLVSGNFRIAGNQEVNGIAAWNPVSESWDALGAGFNGTVYGMAIYDGSLYAGGSFTQSGGNTLNAIAVWNELTSEWESPGFGFTSGNPNDFTFVHTLEVIDEVLYVAGGLKNLEYDDGSIIPCGGIVSYNGESINTFNGGVAGNDIEGIIKTADGQLLIGGGVFGSGYLGILSNTSSSEELVKKQDINIYPNPTNGSVWISSTHPILGYDVYTMEGKLIGSKSYDIHTAINFEIFSPGIYVVKIQTEKGIVGKKIVVD